jgi:hypothetical protein
MDYSHNPRSHLCNKKIRAYCKVKYIELLLLNGFK